MCVMVWDLGDRNENSIKQFLTNKIRIIHMLKRKKKKKLRIENRC